MKKVWKEPKIDELNITENTEYTYKEGGTPDGGVWTENGIPGGPEYIS